MDEPFATLNLDDLTSNKALTKIRLEGVASENYKMEVVLKHRQKRYEISKCSTNAFRVISNQGLLTKEEKVIRRRFSVSVYNEEGIIIPEGSTNISMSPLNTGQVSSSRILSGLQNRFPYIYFNGAALLKQHGNKLLVEFYLRPISPSEMKEDPMIKESNRPSKKRIPSHQKKQTQTKKTKSSELSIPLRAKPPLYIFAIGKDSCLIKEERHSTCLKEKESKIYEKDIQTEDAYQPLHVEDVMSESPKDFELDMILEVEDASDNEKFLNALDKIEFEAGEKDNEFYSRLYN